VKKYNTEAIVLKSINYKDKDKIYTVFTERYGKFSIVGRGVRKISSKRGGNLDSLNHISIKVTEMDNGLKNLDEVIVLNSFKDIKANYPKSLKAYYFAELINKNIEESFEDPKVFKLFKRCLEILDKDSLPVPILTLFFEMHLLKELGYFPELPRDEAMSSVLKKLLRGDFKDLNIIAIEKTSLFIKDHIYNNLNSSLKSLEL